MSDSKRWLISTLVSLVLFAVLGGQWVVMNRYLIETSQLESEEEALSYLEENWGARLEQQGMTLDDTLLIKTGIFVQSLQFFNSNDVNLTGYLWQLYEDGIHDDIKPEPGEVGFIFPEQVDSGNSIPPQEIYRRREGDYEVIGWYFESTLRQPFEYGDYPFDHKTVWVRMWPRDFADNILLIPDYDSYDATGTNDIFGIEESIVLETWERENTFFDYKIASYDTNFGIPEYIGQHGTPELHYNFIIKRKFGNAFIIYLLPLFLVASLLFSALLTVSDDDDLSQRHGFDTSVFIGGSSALFFVVLLAHIQLREQFPGTNIVYIEYFYILMYAMLVLSTANTYLFRHRAAPWLKFIHYDDNIMVKLAYWPFILLSLILITFLTEFLR